MGGSIKANCLKQPILMLIVTRLIRYAGKQMAGIVTPVWLAHTSDTGS